MFRCEALTFYYAPCSHVFADALWIVGRMQLGTQVPKLIPSRTEAHVGYYFTQLGTSLAFAA